MANPLDGMPKIIAEDFLYNGRQVGNCVVKYCDKGCEGIRFVLGTAPAISRSHKSGWPYGQRQINEAGKCIRENTALGTIFRGGVRVQASREAV